MIKSLLKSSPKTRKTHLLEKRLLGSHLSEQKWQIFAAVVGYFAWFKSTRYLMLEFSFLREDKKILQQCSRFWNTSKKMLLEGILDFMDLMEKREVNNRCPVSSAWLIYSARK